MEATCASPTFLLMYVPNSKPSPSKICCFAYKSYAHLSCLQITVSCVASWIRFLQWG